jgi:tetratricopeptide (TPR) repeat protein
MVLKRMGGHDLLWSWFLNNRAMHHHLLGNLPAAIKDIREAVAVKEKALGPDNPDTAMSLGNLAIYLGDVGDTEAAIQYSQRALRILETQCGADHPRTAINLSNYSEFLNQVGRFAEARAAARHALDVFEREAEPEGLFVTLSVLALGEAYLGEGMVAEAFPLIERAARNRDSSDSDPTRLGEVHFALARALTAVGRDLPRARALAERARTEFSQARASAITTRVLTRIDAFLADAPGPR